METFDTSPDKFNQEDMENRAVTNPGFIASNRDLDLKSIDQPPCVRISDVHVHQLEGFIVRSHVSADAA